MIWIDVVQQQVDNEPVLYADSIADVVEGQL